LIKKNDFGNHNSPYAAKAINAAIEAAELRDGYMQTLRDICREHGYNFQAFRRWLLRNGLKSAKSKYNAAHRNAVYKNYAQIVVNITVEEKMFIDEYLSKHKLCRTEFVNKAVRHYIEFVKNNEQENV
jgi:hypothetical protein